MSDNKRIFYASQAIHLQPVTTGNAHDYRKPSDYIKYGSWVQPRGLQSAGITTNFNTEPVSQLGTLKIYSQTETAPEVEVTLSKLIDGTAPLYSICTATPDGSNLKTINKDLIEATNSMVNVRFAVFSDTEPHATGVAEYHTMCSGMYLSSIGYNFTVEGNATEEVTLVGTNKTWLKGGNVPGQASSLDTDDNATPYGSGTNFLARRQYVAITGGTVSAPNRDSEGKLSAPENIAFCVLPTGTKGGLPIVGATAAERKPIIQTISINASLNRENINELGFFGPYYKYTALPVEVTSEFEIVSVSGDLVDADSFDEASGCTTSFSNLDYKEIVIKVCGNTDSDSLVIDLGTKNKLTSVNYTGGDTGGGNVTTTFSFQTFNKLNVIPIGSYANFTRFSDSSSTGTSSQATFT